MALRIILRASGPGRGPLSIRKAFENVGREKAGEGMIWLFGALLYSCKAAITSQLRITGIPAAWNT